ncbi:nuclear transport factor 2 family protein [Streptomyces nigra]
MGQAREAMDRLTAAITTADSAAIAEVYAKDAVAVTPDGGELHGRDDITAYWRGCRRRRAAVPPRRRPAVPRPLLVRRRRACGRSGRRGGPAPGGGGAGARASRAG